MIRMYEEIYETYKKVAKDHIDRDLFNRSSNPASELIEDIKNNKMVIYTAFTGDYDTLKEPEFIDENCDYICFTDNPDLKSDTWKIIQMEDSTLDNNRKAKQYKLLPHRYLKDYKYSFWLDGTFKIKGSIREYIYKYLKENSNMLCVVHTERDCIYDEYEASKIIPRYPRAVMEEQVKTYEKEGFPRKYGLAVMGAIFRQHNSPDIIKLMEDWWDENIKFTNQDQLSFAYVAWKNDFHPSVSLIYYWDNEYWAKEGKYHHKVVLQTPITSDNLRSKIGEKVESMDLGDTIELSREELYLLINDVKGMAGYRIDTAGRIAFLEKEYNELLGSNSLKLTKPLRAAGNLARRVKNNHTLRFIKHDKTKFSKRNEMYNILRDLEILKTDKYVEIHPGAFKDPYFHYIEYGFEDDIETKKKYTNPLFNLGYYIAANDLSEDPILHYISEGCFERLKINRTHDFVNSLVLSLDEQFESYVRNRIRHELNHNNYITDFDILTDYIYSNKKFNTNTTKVGVFLEDTFENMNACPFIRLHTPFKELSKSKDYHFFVYGKELMAKLDLDRAINSKIFDIIVIQRINPFGNEILRKAVKHGIKIIYETDDDLLDVNIKNPSYIHIHENLDTTQQIIANSNQIVVSTEELANRFIQRGLGNVEIIRNYYLNNILPIKSFTADNTNKIKIGYFGTVTHDDDLELIHNVILILKDRYKNKNIDIDFEIIGISANNQQDWLKVKKLPYYPMSMESFMAWLSNNIDWDIGIVPLVYNEFNKCKSELKYIEFAALGIPVVASDVDNYKVAIEDGVNGFLANNEQEWVNKISLLIENPMLRNGLVNNARDNILKNYSLSSRVKQWDTIFKKLSA